MNKSAKVSKATEFLTENSHTRSTGKSALSQVRNAATGHYITRDFAAGKFVNTGDKPAEGIRIIKIFKSANNPSVTKETAALAEKAVLAIKNNVVK